MKLSVKKVFKQKTSIKQELEKALVNKIPISYSILAKLVGISLYRVKKYCKSRNINIDSYNVEILNAKLPKIKKESDSESPKKKKKIKKIDLGHPAPNKISLEKSNNIKFKFDD